MARQLNHHCRQMKKTIVLLALWVSVGLLAAAPLDVSVLKRPVRVACIGDSITAGVGTTQDNSYPTQLSRMLGVKWVVMNFGVGSTTLLNHGDKPYQKEAAFKRALEFQPDVVVIKLGTNDTKPHNWKFKDEFLADFKDLIRRFAWLPGKPRIYICRPAFVPGNGNYGINEAGVLEEIPMLDEIAAAEKVDVIDIHAALKGHPEMLPGHVHPNNAGATVMAKTVFQALTGKEFTGAALIVITESGK